MPLVMCGRRAVVYQPAAAGDERHMELARQKL